MDAGGDLFPVMKFQSLLLLAASLVLSHCTPYEASPGGVTQVTNPNGLPPGHQPYDGPHQATYDLGMAKGRADGAGGQSRQPSRHYGEFHVSETDAFNRGYQAGYSLAIQRPATPALPGEAAEPMSVTGTLTPVKGVGSVTIRRGNQVVCVCRTAEPRVEEVRFHDGQSQIVVKSRAAHGPAVIQRFNTTTGAEIGRVMAYEVNYGRPTWAASMAE